MTWAGFARWSIFVPFLTVLIALSVGVTWYVTADLTPPLAQTGDPIMRREDGSVGEFWRAGDKIYLDLPICVSRSLPGTLARTYTDTTVQKLQDLSAPTTVVGCRIERIPTDIPRVFLPGPYVLKSEITHRVRWQEITYKLRELPVVVTANPLTDSVDARYLALKRENATQALRITQNAALAERITRIERYLKLPPMVPGAKAPTP